MRLAIREGQRGEGFVVPNPLVGCAIVDREHRLLSLGHHARVGQDHAEVDALKKLRDPSLIEGAHVYVTLEPCAHQGRTPSCARTLVPLKPASVTYAVEDPNPLVAGKGAEILREAGIVTQKFSERRDVDATERDEIEAQAEELAEIFLHNFRAKLPFVAVKIASSLDGQMGLRSGESKWITGEAARTRVQLIRAKYDAVLVGRGTYVADDPSLNVRHDSFPGFQNKAVVLDPRGATLATLSQSNLLKVRPPENVFVVVGESTKIEAGVKVGIVRAKTTDAGEFDLRSVLASLKSAGLTSILVEGGALTIGAFMGAREVQRLHLFLAPSLIGGAQGLSWSSGFGVRTLADKFQLTRSRVEWTGEDLYWTARVR